MTVDAVIVGSGPGGSTVADVLTAAGWTVTIIEKGRNHLLDPDDLTRPASDFSNDEVKFRSRYFLGPDPLVEPRTFRSSDEDGERTFVGEVNSVPSTVGGGGTHADGKVPRFRADDFRLLSRFGPQEGADVADWPIDYDELEPYYAEVERSVGVAGTDGANPFAEPRSGPFPMPSGAPMFGATRSVAAAERLGYHPYPAPTAANSVPYDGRPACNNCGFCSFFGCPIHAKGDPVAMLRRALGTGRAELLAETFVPRIRTAGRPGDRGRRGRARRHGAIPRRPARGRGRRCHRDTPPAAAVGLRAPAHRAVPDDPLPDHRRRGHAVPHLRRTGPGRHPRARRHDRGRRALPAGGPRRRPAVAARGTGGAQRGGPAHPGGDPLPVGARPRRPDGRLADPVQAVGDDHAGRGPAVRLEPGRPRSDGARRPGLSGRPGSPTVPGATSMRPPTTSARGWPPS